jgi:hypothetical protein
MGKENKALNFIINNKSYLFLVYLVLVIVSIKIIKKGKNQKVLLNSGYASIPHSITSRPSISSSSSALNGINLLIIKIVIYEIVKVKIPTSIIPLI